MPSPRKSKTCRAMISEKRPRTRPTFSRGLCAAHFKETEEAKLCAVRVPDIVLLERKPFEWTGYLKGSLVRMRTQEELQANASTQLE